MLNRPSRDRSDQKSTLSPSDIVLEELKSALSIGSHEAEYDGKELEGGGFRRNAFEQERNSDDYLHDNQKSSRQAVGTPSSPQDEPAASRSKRLLHKTRRLRTAKYLKSVFSKN